MSRHSPDWLSHTRTDLSLLPLTNLSPLGEKSTDTTGLYKWKWDTRTLSGVSHFLTLCDQWEWECTFHCAIPTLWFSYPLIQWPLSVHQKKTAHKQQHHYRKRQLWRSLTTDSWQTIFDCSNLKEHKPKEVHSPVRHKGVCSTMCPCTGHHSQRHIVLNN